MTMTKLNVYTKNKKKQIQKIYEKIRKNKMNEVAGDIVQILYNFLMMKVKGFKIITTIVCVCSCIRVE
jgi:hypothetical protein